MAESLQISVDLPVSIERAYRAWLDSYEFSRFSGRAAQMRAAPGEAYTILDGEVRGQIEAATPFNRIVQTWRSADFPEGAPESRVEIVLEPTCTGCQLSLRHTGIPDGQTRPLLQRWETEILRPLKRYFDELVGDIPHDMDG